MDQTGENSIVIVGGANVAYQSLTELPESYKVGIDACDYLMLQKEIPMAINILAAKYARSKGKFVMLDCGGSDEEISDELMKNLTFISPNTTELLRIDPTIDSDKENVVESIRQKLITKYPGITFILKMGSKGSKVITDKLNIYTNVVTKLNPAVLNDYKIVDTVGAGDCFTSAFLVRHSQFNWSDPANWEKQYSDCLMFGNASAFLCITKKGAMPSLPYRKDVDEFIKNYMEPLGKKTQ